MEPSDILYILGITGLTSLLCGVIVLKACDAHKQRRLRDQIMREKLSPTATTGPTTTDPLLIV